MYTYSEAIHIESLLPNDCFENWQTLCLNMVWRPAFYQATLFDEIRFHELTKIMLSAFGKI